MDHNGEMPPPRPSLFRSMRRKSSLSGKLNQLTSNPFTRRRTSNTISSSESSSSLRRRSRIPTPSFGSHTSSLFGGLRLSNGEDNESTETQRGNGKESQDRRLIRSSQKHSDLASGSTSSFFGNNNSGVLYPNEFLENPEASTAGKENESQSMLSTDSSRGIYLPSFFGAGHESNEDIKKAFRQKTETSEINNVPSAIESHIGESKEWTPVTKRSSRSIPPPLANAPFFRLHSARHSLAAVPQSSSQIPKDRESSVVIEERRLMAPINPPVPRSTTMNAVPNTSTARASSYQSSPQTPNFMRPTSSSAARSTEPSKPFKVFKPPPPLKIPRRKTTDMVGFGRHRERKNAFDEYALLESGTHPDFLPGNVPQVKSTDQPVAATTQPVAATAQPVAATDQPVATTISGELGHAAAVTIHDLLFHSSISLRSRGSSGLASQGIRS